MNLSNRRVADATKLLTALERDQIFTQRFLSGFITPEAVQQAAAYVAETYSCSKQEAEEAINHRIRSTQRRDSTLLSNHKAQKQIIIPPTATTPAGRTIPVEKLAPPTPVPDAPLTIDASPPQTPAAKVEDVTKPIITDPASRQQAVIDATKAHKITTAELGKAMYGLELTEESLGKYLTKAIETISSIAAAQTATTVKTLVSPLTGGN